MRKSDKNVQAIVIAIAGVVSSVAAANAASINWGASAYGSWNDPANWSGGVIPGSTDIALIRWPNPGPSTGSISLDAPQAIAELQFPAYGYQNILTIGTANDLANGNTLTLTNVFRGDNVGNVQTIAANVLLSDDARFSIRPGYNNGAAVSGSISGAKSLTKDAAGTLELSGANTYSGGTILKQGTLTLNFNTSIAPANDILKNSSTLRLSGGGFRVNGKNAANAINSQTLGGVTVAAGSSNISIVNGVGSGKTQLALGNISREVGGTVNFDQPTVNTTISATNGYTTSTTNDTGGILGGWATVGAANWATNNGTNVVALSTYTNDTWAAGNNTSVTVDATPGSPITDATTHSLRFNAAGARTLNLSGTNVVTSGGVMVTSAVGANATTITGGTLTSGSSDLVIHQYNTNNAGAMTVASAIADNGASSVALTKTGGGVLNASGTLSYTGGTYVNGGTLVVGGSSTTTGTTASGSSSVTVANASLFTVGQTVTGSNIPFGTRVIAIDTANNKITLSQNASGAGSNVSIRYYTAGGSNALSQTGDIIATGGTLEFGNSSFSQNTSGTVRVAGGNLSNGKITKSGADYDVQAGSISTVLDGSVGLVKTTGGSVSLSGANTYTGDTWVKEGSLSASVSGAIKGNLIVGNPNGGPSAWYSQSSTPLNASKKVTVYANGSAGMGGAAQAITTVEIYGGTFDGGSQTYLQGGNSITMTGGTLAGTFYLNRASIKSLPSNSTANVTGSLTQAAAFDVADGAAAVDMAFTGAASSGNGLTKNGLGVLRATGNNSYTGATAVNGGTFWVSGTGAINGTSGITVNNDAIFKYDSSTALTKVPTLNNTATFIYNSPAKLGGNITIASGRKLGGSGTLANVTVNGLLSPGNSPGQMTVDSLILGSTATMEIGGDVLGSEYDNVSIATAGGLTYGGTLDVVALGSYEITGSYSLFSFTGAYSGEFAAVNVNGFALTNSGGVWSGTQGETTYTFSDSTGALSVPEPSMLGLAVGTLCFGLARRQRKSA